MGDLDDEGPSPIMMRSQQSNLNGYPGPPEQQELTNGQVAARIASSFSLVARMNSLAPNFMKSKVNALMKQKGSADPRRARPVPSADIRINPRSQSSHPQMTDDSQLEAFYKDNFNEDFKDEEKGEDEDEQDSDDLELADEVKQSKYATSGRFLGRKFTTRGVLLRVIVDRLYPKHLPIHLNDSIPFQVGKESTRDSCC